MALQLWIKIGVYTLLAASPIFLFLPLDWFPSFYDVRYMGLGSFAEAALIILIPDLLRVPIGAPDYRKKNLAVDRFQFLLVLLVFTNALGDLGLYQLYQFGIEFDKILHVVDPLMSAILGYIFLRDRFGLSAQRTRWTTFGIVFAAGLLWELTEYMLDLTLHSRLFGVNGVNINHDTQLDILCDFLGAAAGVTFMTFRDKIRAGARNLILIAR